MNSVFSFLLALLLSGCGYTLSQSRSTLVEEQKIRSVYLAPVQNNTFKTGIENVVYNSLLRTYSQYQKIRVTQSKKDADSILYINVSQAGYAPSATTATSNLEPSALGDPNIYVASHYGASLACSFILEKLVDGKSVGNLWSGNFSRGKTFQANTQLGVLGTTSHLINESEFDRALTDLAEQISSDAHEAMLQGF